jgi:hypothetical protein
MNKSYKIDYMETEWHWNFISGQWIKVSGTTRLWFDGDQIKMYCNAYTKDRSLELVSIWRKMKQKPFFVQEKENLDEEDKSIIA